MSEIKHTPGPWYWLENRFWGGFSGLYDEAGNEVLVANTSNEGDTGAAWFEDFPSEADRKLIAAAPELLAACQKIVDAVEDGDEMAAVEMAEAAIAKATGV